MKLLLFAVLLVVIFAVDASRRIQVPSDFGEKCYKKGLGYRFQNDQCMGCICSARSTGQFIYQCSFCANVNLSHRARQAGCRVVQGSGSNFPSCCPDVQCPPGSRFSVTVHNRWPKAPRNVPPPPARHTDRFIDYPRTCYINGPGSVLRTTPKFKCDTCHCTEKGGWRCTRRWRC